MNDHADFILSPITDILKDVVFASDAIGSGIETYPLCNYIMQSVFLKMTGFQEQKMKCICWELATNDYEYRRVLLSDDDKLGECSSYKDKNKIYKRLVEQINKHNSNFDIESNIDKERILLETNSVIEKLSNSNLSIWDQKNFVKFISDETLIKSQFFILNDNKDNHNLFGNTLQDKYLLLYKHRNRCAHNTLSYQQNLPTLKTLADDNYKYDNYFVRFALLILIDKVFIELYKKYLEVFED